MFSTSQKHSQPEKVNKISVLPKMIGLQKKRPAPAAEYVVPNNSVLNLPHRPGLYDPTPNSMEKNDGRKGVTSGGAATSKCRYCENMAKNFLYLESLIRNNGEKGSSGHKTCSLCNSSLKYLEYVNRNIRQVFGDFDSIVQADRALAAKPAMMPKYSVGPPPTLQQATQDKADSRARGGAVLSPQKSTRSVKPKSVLPKSKSKEKPLKSGKGQKSLKSLKSLKSHKTKEKAIKGMKGQKSLKSLKSHKSLKSLKSSKSTKSARSQRKSAPRSKGGSGHGKMVLKRKFRSGKVGGKSASGKVVRSVSQYHNLGSVRSKLSKGASLKKLVKQRSQGPPPASINWRLLKRNLPKRPIAAN
ncbi:uncharacterized protein Dana_GF18711 [Drosophila ananassae]|uniref:Uncharacterized protein n=1 Tax=Drosophila ananassae TaxID=7217 RepID=B3LXK8_DROAN|nr:uncharacterized protein LOC6501481 [Drosophila ananassae]EDV43902.2 uncharacterized protein Dana_GF18711 [Drosophila ananassae]